MPKDAGDDDAESSLSPVANVRVANWFLGRRALNGREEGAEDVNMMARRGTFLKEIATLDGNVMAAANAIVSALQDDEKDSPKRRTNRTLQCLLPFASVEASGDAVIRQRFCESTRNRTTTVQNQWGIATPPPQFAP
jgi:hypothetical protein